MVDAVNTPEGMPGVPRRIGLVVEDVDGRVWAFDADDVQDARLLIDYPNTRGVPMNLPTAEYASALARAMQAKRVSLSFTTGTPWKWRVR